MVGKHAEVPESICVNGVGTSSELVVRCVSAKRKARTWKCKNMDEHRRSQTYRADRGKRAYDGLSWQVVHSIAEITDKKCRYGGRKGMLSLRVGVAEDAIAEKSFCVNSIDAALRNPTGA